MKDDVTKTAHPHWFSQVDVAPTILGLAGLATPPHMDGRSVVPLLVSEQAAQEQGEVVPGSVRRHLTTTSTPPARLASFHSYYNQGPWDVSDRHRLDDWSNTWAGLHFVDPARGHDLKYGVFDPWGKQNGFVRPYMRVLFNLTTDPYELHNIYNQTIESVQGASLVSEMNDLLMRYNNCQGQSCP